MLHSTRKCRRAKNTTISQSEPDAEGFTIPANFPFIELWEVDNFILTTGGQGASPHSSWCIFKTVSLKIKERLSEIF